MMLRATKTARAQRGYALMMVLFISAVMVIMAAAAMPNILTEGKRQKEEEMIWRGGQYERAVRLYFHKYGRFPQKVDDLVKANNGVRFLRQAYPDPSNKADGSWRLIYITPAGLLIGSVRYKSLAELNAAQHPGMPTPFGMVPVAGNAPGNPMQFGGPGPQGMQPGGMPLQSGIGQGMPQFQTPGGQPQNPNPSAFSSSPGAQLQPSDMSGGSVIGGNVIGVGGTAKKASLKVFEGGKTYRDWEFIWNPLAEATIGNQTGALPGQPVTGPGGPQGAPAFGAPTSMPTPQSPQNPPPQPPQNPPNPQPPQP